MLRTPTGSWVERFVGMDAEGVIDGRRLQPWGLRKDSYKAWIDYFHRKMDTDRWEDVERYMARHAGNFNVVLGGYLLRETGIGWRAEVDALFRDLVVDQDVSDAPARHLRGSVERILTRANILATPDVVVRAKFGDVFDDLEFDYGYQNGQLHLMKAVPLGGPGGMTQALAFKARAAAAREANAAQSFLAFYDGRSVTAEAVLHPVQAEAFAIDVEDEREAAENVLDLVGG